MAYLSANPMSQEGDWDIQRPSTQPKPAAVKKPLIVFKPITITSRPASPVAAAGMSPLMIFGLIGVAAFILMKGRR